MAVISLLSKEKACAALLGGRDVLLMAPCGAGKSLVYEMTIDIMRQDSPNKVLVLCLPVNKILEEKSATNRLPTAYVTMSGRVVVDCEEGEMDSDVSVTEELLESILRGDYAILMGHAESWSQSVQ